MATTTTYTDVNRTAAIIIGGVLVLVGILGFFPAFVTNGALFGVFGINLLHNVIHILTGGVLLAAAFIDHGANARMANLVLGVVYLIVAIAGFVPAFNALIGAGGTSPAVSPYADLGLHAVLGIVLLGVAMMVKAETTRPLTGSRI